MKQPSFEKSTLRRAFTLAELLVAMAITLVLISVTVTITATALDAWRAARGELRAAQQAQIMLSTLASDLRGMVVKNNTAGEWFRIRSERAQIGPAGDTSPNPTRMYFFTSALDRYNGSVGGQNGDQGGSVAMVQYELAYGDPIFGEQENTNLNTFVMYRSLIDPDETFRSFIGRDDLTRGAGGGGVAGRARVGDYLCDGIYEFTVTATIEYRDDDNEIVTEKVPVIASGTGRAVRDFAIRDGKILKDQSDRSEVANGRIRSFDIGITVLTEEGLRILKNRRFSDDRQKAIFLNEHTHQFSQSVAIPSV